jgi:CheY-like chemotaxis protein
MTMPKASDPPVVLLVEDEPAQLRLFADSLRREGYVVRESRNGMEALDLVGTMEKLDLLVTDIVMPRMKGFELAHRLRALFPALPILFISGHPMTEELDPNEYPMEKPFAREEFVKRVAELVKPPAVPNAL